MYKPHKKLEPIQTFQLFCIESYRNARGITGLQALQEFKQAEVFEFLASGYEVLHTQSKKFILNEVEQYIKHQNGIVSRKYRKD